MRLTIDVTETDVTVTTVAGGIDHSGTGESLAAAVDAWTSGARYMAERWDSFGKSPRASASEIQMSADLMAALASTTRPEQVRALLFVAFQMQSLLSTAPLTPSAAHAE